MALEKKTVKGKTRARCPKCGKWQPYDETAFYFHAGEEDAYLGHCRSCERARSAEWHRQKRAKAKKPAAKKS